ncbi:MAG TPA: cytochrome c [Candidatus Polarisedimenticolia bacterium]|nr:cytochrome c [Candidatus Polarisedimenticolia bacterium]
MRIRRLAAVCLSVLAAGSLALAQDAAQVEKGKAVFAAANPKCTMCHSVAGQGNAKHPLDGVGGKLSGDDIKAWIRTPKEMAAKAKSEGKPPMMAYPKEKISDADLDSLVAYLLSLK